MLRTMMPLLQVKGASGSSTMFRIIMDCLRTEHINLHMEFDRPRQRGQRTQRQDQTKDSESKTNPHPTQLLFGCAGNFFPASKPQCKPLQRFYLLHASQASRAKSLSMQAKPQRLKASPCKPRIQASKAKSLSKSSLSIYIYIPSQDPLAKIL